MLKSERNSEDLAQSPTNRTNNLDILHLDSEKHNKMTTTSFNRSAVFAYIIFFFLGIGNLLPFFAFVIAQAYYANKFCTTVFNESFESFISIFYNMSQPLGLLYTIKYKNSLSTGAQVVYPLIVYAILFAFTTLFVLIKNMKGDSLFAITLICAFMCGLMSAIMNGGLFGLTGIVCWPLDLLTDVYGN